MTVVAPTGHIVDIDSEGPSPAFIPSNYTVSNGIATPRKKTQSGDFFEISRDLRVCTNGENWTISFYRTQRFFKLQIYALIFIPAAKDVQESAATLCFVFVIRLV